MDCMARGWEANRWKSSSRRPAAQVESKQRLTPEQAALKQAREALDCPAGGCCSNSDPPRILAIAKCLKAPFPSSIAAGHDWAKSMWVEFESIFRV